MTKNKKIEFVIDYFEKDYPHPVTELYYQNPYQLIVAVTLSAQCTDKRVNLVTPPFFEVFNSFASLAQASFEDVFKLIKSISYPNNKARHLIGMAKIVADTYNSELPNTVEDLMKLPGVGRKTANVLTSVLFNQPNMAVDTHVFRVSHRLGLVNSKASTPLLVEKALIKIFPQQIIPKAHHWLILHGRYVCVARNPKCQTCLLKTICVYFKNQASK